MYLPVPSETSTTDEVAAQPVPAAPVPAEPVPSGTSSGSLDETEAGAKAAPQAAAELPANSSSNEPGTNEPGTNKPGTNKPGTNDSGTSEMSPTDRSPEAESAESPAASPTEENEAPETTAQGDTAQQDAEPDTTAANPVGLPAPEPEAAAAERPASSGTEAVPAEPGEASKEQPAGDVNQTVEQAAEKPALPPETAPEPDDRDNSQQAALPKVTAPDHDSLPLWQRNRQVIDRRSLKDASGNPKPRIAFILSELGHSRTAAEEIIKKLPPAITLSFSPYANPRSLEYLSALARSNGHEVMLDLPLEPTDFPQRDPGPKALLLALEPQENLERLRWSLERASGYVGVAVWMGSRFVASPRQMRPLMETLHDRGLVYLDNAEREDSLGPSLAGELNVPAVTSHRYVDVPLASRDAIDARLAQVERIALQFGSAVAMGRPFPVTVERLAVWSAELEKRGIILVPITVLAEDAASYSGTGRPATARDHGSAQGESAADSATSN